MPNIIGTAPNQVPTNADLGTMAYQDAALYQNINQSQTGFKNRIINGAMMIDQRNAGAGVSAADGQYITDRFKARLTQVNKLYWQQLSTAPIGFTKSLNVTTTSAYSVGASDSFSIQQVIEGFNVADLGWGAAGAASVTLSFWTRSSLTGTFGGSLFNGAANRSYPFAYTINSANTWEQKSITIAGDTAGTWATDNSAGITVSFGLGQGSTYSGTAGSWSGNLYLNATGATSVVGTNGATFYITGVQLEKGSTATSFDYRPYGTELALCYRYYQSIPDETVVASRSTYGTGKYDSWLFPVKMRASPTLSVVGYTGGGTLYTSVTDSGFFIGNSGNESGIGYTALAEL